MYEIQVLVGRALCGIADFLCEGEFTVGVEPEDGDRIYADGDEVIRGWIRIKLSEEGPERSGLGSLHAAKLRRATEISMRWRLRSVLPRCGAYSATAAGSRSAAAGTACICGTISG